MSHWNHRVVRTRFEGDPSCTERLAIHEVYYHDDGTVRGWTENPEAAIDFDNEDDGPASIESLRETLQLMLAACDEPIVEGETVACGGPRSQG